METVAGMARKGKGKSNAQEASGKGRGLADGRAGRGLAGGRSPENQRAMPELSIIIPTYNEAGNIREIVRRIHESLSPKKQARDKTAGCMTYEIVVVDDDSPDGTGRIAQELSFKYPMNVLIRRGKRGLATAVLDGYARARGKLLCVMDSDLSHPPEVLPRMISEMEKKGADIAIASRYVKGGGIRGWPFIRKVTSWGATTLAIGLTKVKDPMSGFYIIRRGVTQGVKLKPAGYKILLEILVRGKYKKAIEVPFIFTDRVQGSSKLNMKTNLTYLRHLWQLYRYRLFG